MFHNSRITDWQGQVVWLIGAASAFDHALARELHARGAHVLLSPAEGRALPGAAESQPGGIVPLPLDVRQRSALTAGCTRIVREHGRLDVVVRCAIPDEGAAAPTGTAPAAAALPEAVQHLLDTVVPLLRRQGHGHLSLVAHEKESRRGAVQGPTRAMVEKLRAELPSGIGVSAIHAAAADGAPAGAAGAALDTRQAAERAVQGLARGHSGIEAPRRATLWQRLRGQAGAAPDASGGVRR